MTKSLLPTNIFNLEKDDYEVPKVFLGQPDGLLDTVNSHFPDLFSIYKRLRKLDWDELEFDFSSCLTDFETCDKSTYDMMFKTLIWQWEADSIAARKFISIIASFVTDSRVWMGENRISENECYTPDHEVLMADGTWKWIDEVKVGDEVKQWNPETLKIETVKVEGIIAKWYKGDIYHFTSNNSDTPVNQLVTANHRMPVMIENNTTVDQLAKDVTYNEHNSFPIWNGEVTESVKGSYINVTKHPYNNTVHCITVPSSYFIVRRDGITSVGGNCVHAATYSEIVRNSFTNPNEIMDEVAKVTEAHERMKVVSWVLDEAYTAANEYNLGIRKNDQDLHDIAYLLFNAVYMFERIQFMASFAVTFAICKTGLFQPIGHAVKKIAQDEFEIHAQYRQGIIRHTLKTREGLKSYENTKAKVVELFIEVIKSEIEWIDYLFSEGRSLAGINEKKLFDWVLFNANAVKVFLGITDEELSDYALEYENFTGEALVFPTVNPLPYMEEYMDISASQGSPQEEKSKSDYQVNLMDSRGEEEIFDF